MATKLKSKTKPKHYLKFKHWPCYILFTKYLSNDSTTLLLQHKYTHEHIATATVCIPDVPVKPGYVLIKSWSENEGMAKALQSANIIGPELGQVPTGHTYATVHKLLV